jgi:hypothetical protein
VVIVLLILLKNVMEAAAVPQTARFKLLVLSVEDPTEFVTNQNIVMEYLVLVLLTLLFLEPFADLLLVNVMPLNTALELLPIVVLMVNLPLYVVLNLENVTLLTIAMVSPILVALITRKLMELAAMTKNLALPTALVNLESVNLYLMTFAIQNAVMGSLTLKHLIMNSVMTVIT